MKQHKTVYVNWWQEILFILQQLGLDTQVITEQLPGLSTAQQQAGQWLEVSLARQLWHQIFQLSQDPAIGFKVGKRLSIRAFGVLAPVLSHSPSLNAALQNMLRYQVLLSQSGHFSAEFMGDELRLHYRPAPSHVPIHYTQIDSILTAFVKGLRMLLGEFVRLQKIHFTGPKPKEQHLHQAFFDCALEFNAPRASLSLSVTSLQQEMVDHDPVVYRLNKNLAEDRLWQINNSEQLHTSIKEVIANMGYAQANMHQVAEQLALSSRTLQRKLQQTGSSFRQLQEQLILKEVTALLVDTKLSINEVGQLMGYTETSSFSRAIKKLTGNSPACIRRIYSK